MRTIPSARPACRRICLVCLALIFVLTANTGCAAKKGASDKPAKARASQAAGPATVREMLRSAGRKPHARQPEAGFYLNAPASVGDGEPFLVEFAARDAKSLSISFAGKKLTLPSPTRGRFQALLAVPLDEKARSLPLALTVTWKKGAKETFTTSLPVLRRSYPEQKLKVNPKYVSPPARYAEKIKRDRAEFRAAVSKVTTRQYWNLPLERPVPGRVTSVYGARRVFNGVRKNAHKGVDFRGAQGTPVRSVDQGRVALAADHYYGGNTVIVDHGLGVFSVYLHLSAFHVRQGQEVKRGQVLGEVGSTGRSTGPHLHFSLYVMGESVNGAVFLK